MDGGDKVMSPGFSSLPRAWADTWATSVDWPTRIGLPPSGWTTELAGGGSREACSPLLGTYRLELTHQNPVLLHSASPAAGVLPASFTAPLLPV